MVRSKNKPKKNAAAVSPAALPSGTTEVIVAAAAGAHAAAADVASTSAVADVASTSATFMQAPNPTFAEPDATNPTDADQPAAAEEPKTDEPKTEEPKTDEPKEEQPADVAAQLPKENFINQALAPLPETGSGIFAFFRRFYNSLGGAIHR